MIAHRQKVLIGDLINHLTKQYGHFCLEVRINSIEEAYNHVYNNVLQEPNNLNSKEKKESINITMTEVD